MARKMNTKASLQISTEDAIKQIEALSEKLAQLKQTYCSDPKALAVKLSVDTSQISTINNSLNSFYNSFQKKATNTQTAINTSTAKTLANQTNAYRDFWDANLSKAEKYSQKLNEIKLQAQQKNGIAGYNVMNSSQRAAALDRAFPKTSAIPTSNSTSILDWAAPGRVQNLYDSYKVAASVGALSDFNRAMDEVAQKSKEAADIKRYEEQMEKQALREQEQLISTSIRSTRNLRQELDTVFQLAQQTIQLYDKFRQVGSGMLSGIQASANQLFNILGLNVDTILADSVAQEEKLQMARIGFKNMFGADQVDALEARVRETAAKSPGLNSGDLADYIAQLGAVSNGADQAYNVTMGILKTVQYGGGDASGQMNYIIKNIRDVMAKGKATQVDVQQFNRAMPLLVKALEGVGQSQFLKNGQLTITKDNAKNLMEAFAALNDPSNPAYGVFDDTAKTWAGVKEEFYETTQNLVNSALREVGFYDALQDIMRNGIFPIIDDAADYFKDLLVRINAGTNWDEVQTQLKVTWEGVKGAAKELINGIIETFAVVREDGSIDATASIKSFIKIIGSFFEGLFNGIKFVVDMAGKVKNLLGDEGLTNIAGALGWSVVGGGAVSGIAGGALSGVQGLVNTGLQLKEISLLKQQNALRMGMSSGSTSGILGTGKRLLDNVSYKVGGSGFNGSMFLGGATLYGLSTTIGKLITEFNLLGDASKAAGTTVTVAGGTLGGALTGLAFGGVGAAAGALIGLAASAVQAQAELRKLEVQKTDENISAEKLKELTDISDQAAALLTEQGSKMDWASDEGKWVKQALINEMAGMTQAELNEFVTSGKAYDRFAELSNMKQRQVAMSLVDNEKDFWSMQGNKARLIIDNKDGTFSATEYGERFANIIRANNMVGWNDAKKLEEASAATLIQAYTQKQGEAANDVLNDTQINYLISQSDVIAQNVGEVTTNFAKKITDAVDTAGGNVTEAITAAEKGGDEAFAAVLRMYRTMKDRANEASDYMLGELEGDEIVNPETAGQLYGDQAQDAMKRWNDHTSNWFTGFVDMFNLSRSSLSTAFGLGNTIFDGGTFAELSTRVYKGDQALNKMIQESTGEEKETLQAVRQALQANINEMNSLQEGDWNGLWDVLKRIKDMLAYYGIDITKPNVEVGARAGLGGGGGGWATGGFVGRQGHIVPIYRAMGGSIRGVDTINAMLSPGEFVQRASAVTKAGFGVMNALNQGDLSQAYRLLGAKVNNHNNNSRVWTSTDSHNTTQGQVIVNNNYGRSARANAYYGAHNFMSL